MVLNLKNLVLLFISLFPSKLKIPLYSLFGYKISRNVSLGFLSIIDIETKAEFAEGSKIAPFTYIKAKEFYIGKYSIISPFSFISVPKVYIGNDTKISNFVIIRSGHVTKYSELFVGDLVHIFPFVTIDCSRKVTIGDGTGVGPQCNIFTHSSYKSILDGYNVVYNNVNIGKRVELTYSVFVAPGVTIGDDAICAYGSYVNSDIPEGVLAAGLPAKVKRNKDQFVKNIDQIQKLDILNNIVLEFQDYFQLTEGRHPFNVIICNYNKEIKIQNNTAYIILKGYTPIKSNFTYAVFNIEEGKCYNWGFNKTDFNALRKFLSRYGIRFLTC
jgi:acetyltransferase-like isoleucine patch superfamily enzyme